MVGPRKLPDPSSNHIFNALSIGVQYTLSFQLTNFDLKCLVARLFKRVHIVRACALLRQLKPVILKCRHSSNSLAAKNTWILYYFMLWLPQPKRKVVPKDLASSKRPSDHLKRYIQCKLEFP